MSRSTFLTTSSSLDASEIQNHPTTQSTNTDRTSTLRFHHRLMPTISSTSRSNETVPAVGVQSSSSSSTTTTIIDTTTTNPTQHKSVVRLNPKLKRNLRGTRRSTGIRPDDVSSANSLNDPNFNDDGEEEDKPTTSNQFITITSNEPSEPFDLNRNSPPKPVFKVSRVQPAFDESTRHLFEKLSTNRTDPFIIAQPFSSSSSNTYPNPSGKMFRPEQFILRRQASDDDSTSVKRRQLEERISKLESLIYDKDSIILDLQHQLDKATRDLKDLEQQIYILQRDKLALIKTVTSLQDTKSSSAGGPGDLSTAKRTGFMTRN